MVVVVVVVVVERFDGAVISVVAVEGGVGRVVTTRWVRSEVGSLAVMVVESAETVAEVNRAEVVVEAHEGHCTVADAVMVDDIDQD